MNAGMKRRTTFIPCAEYHASTVFVLSAAATLLAAYDLYLLARGYH